MQGGIVAVGVAFPGSRLDVRGNQLQAVAERMREFKERLPQIADKARADLEAASALNAFQARGLAQLDKDLEDLLKLFA